MPKYTTEKVDIEHIYDFPIFDELSDCLKKILTLIDDIPEKDLKQGYYVAMCKNTPPKINEQYYDLKFKLRDDIKK